MLVQDHSSVDRYTTSCIYHDWLNLPPRRGEILKGPLVLKQKDSIRDKKQSLLMEFFFYQLKEWETGRETVADRELREASEHSERATPAYLASRVVERAGRFARSAQNLLPLKKQLNISKWLMEKKESAPLGGGLSKKEDGSPQKKHLVSIRIVWHAVERGCNMECINQKTIWPHRSVEWLDAGGIEKPIQVPCGKCVACLVNKRSDWSFRLEQEHKVAKSSFFVTLTYNEKHLRSDRSLNKRDLQLYLKRLRKRHGIRSSIRYYAVGEYGSITGRPHYHILLFNSVEEHMRTAWVDSKGAAIGIVHVGTVTAASIAYCTKYIIQRDNWPEGLEKPFATMSRAYGIGAHYLSDAMVDWHRENDANYVVKPGNIRGALSRFYKSKIWYKQHDRDRIGEAALSYALVKRAKAEAHYKKTAGERWLAVMTEANNRLLARVKTKVQYSQSI